MALQAAAGIYELTSYSSPAFFPPPVQHDYNDGGQSGQAGQSDRRDRRGQRGSKKRDSGGVSLVPAANAGNDLTPGSQEWLDEKKPDGRYLRHTNGSDFCFTFTRFKGGCSSDGVCVQAVKRQHACEWCRGPHRSVDCTSHPGWKPAPANNKQKGAKGKGKGK